MTEHTDTLTPANELALPTQESFQDVITVAIDELHTASWNADTRYDDASLEELGTDMRTNGQLQPILVRQHPTLEGRVYEVISGEKRHQAARRVHMALLNAHLLYPCDDLTARRISYRAKAHKSTPDLYTATLDVLNYLALEYATSPGWPDLVEAHGSPLHAAAWITTKCAHSFPHVHPEVATALQASQDDLARPLRSAFRVGNPHGTIKSFVRNRLELLHMDQVLLDHLRDGHIDLTSAGTLHRMSDKTAMLRLLHTAVENKWTRAQILKAARQPRTGNAGRNNLALPPARRFAATVRRLTPEDAKAAANALAVLESLITKYEDNPT